MPAPNEATIENPPVDNAADLMAAMDKGVAEATGELPADVPEPEPVPEPTPEPAPAPEGEPAPTPTPVDGEPTPTPEPAERPSDQFGELPKDAKADTKERFDKMREGYDALHKEHAPIKAALEQAGIKDVAEIPKLAERAKVGEDMVAMVTETGATPQQYGQALDYLADITAFATKGDTKAGERAFQTMQAELQVLAKALGKEVPGIHDPLAGHADLLAAVEAGEVSRKWALETAAARDKSAVAEHRHQATEQQTQAQQAQAKAVQELVEFDQAKAATDPTYVQKRPILNNLVANIRATLPPAKWRKATEDAYAAIVLPTAAAPVPRTEPKPPPGPMRPNGPRPTMAPQYDNPMDAMEAGIKAAG